MTRAANSKILATVSWILIDVLKQLFLIDELVQIGNNTRTYGGVLSIVINIVIIIVLLTKYKEIKASRLSKSSSYSKTKQQVRMTVTLTFR